MKTNSLFFFDARDRKIPLLTTFPPSLSVLCSGPAYVKVLLYTHTVAAIAIEAQIAVVGALARGTLKMRVGRPPVGVVSAGAPFLLEWNAFAVAVVARCTPNVLAAVLADLVIVALEMKVPGLMMVMIASLPACAPWFVFLVMLALDLLRGRFFRFFFLRRRPAMIPPQACGSFLHPTSIVLYITPERIMILQCTVAVRSAPVLERYAATTSALGENPALTLHNRRLLLLDIPRLRITRRLLHVLSYFLCYSL